MPIHFGGGMDDPDNPASPFADRDEIERALSGEETVTMPRDEALKLLCQALLGQLREMREQLRVAKAGGYWGDVDNVINAMTDLLADDED